MIPNDFRKLLFRSNKFANSVCSLLIVDNSIKCLLHKSADTLKKMAQLNEDILRLIFDYLPTPLEWIPVSQVCKLWRSAASKHWRKIQEINYLDYKVKYELKMGKDDKTQVISTETAEKIFYFAAPFVKVLSRCEYFDRNEMLFYSPIDKTVKHIKFGPFVYKLKDFADYKALKLLAKNSTSITEIRFDTEPYDDCLKLLIENNEINKLVISNFFDFYEYIPTDDIEELVLGFSSMDAIETFSGRFPNLKKLELRLSIQKIFSEPLEEALPLLLPHFIGVQSLRLKLKFWKQTSLSCKALMDIAKLSQLEHLAIDTRYTSVEAADFFLTKLAKGCPKLRSIELVYMRVNEKKLRTLLTAFRLEKLTINRVTDFQSVELPEIINLSQLKLKYNIEKLNVTNFCNALKKMPKLKNLEMEVDTDACYKSLRTGVLKGDETWDLVCQVATVAAFHNKDVVVEEMSDYKNIKKLKILRKGAASRGTEIEETLNVVVTFRDNTRFVENVKTFVRDNLTSYDLVVESEED